MPQLKIENIDQATRFTLIPNKVNFFIKAILFFICISTITVPFVVLFSNSVGKTAIVGAILSGFLSIFILRLFLWNTFGKEVFEIGKDSIFHYIDYHFFKDKLFKTQDLNNIHFGYTNDLQNQTKASSEVLDTQINDPTEDYLFIISNHEGELTKSNIKLSFSNVKEMISLLEK